MTMTMLAVVDDMYKDEDRDPDQDSLFYWLARRW